MALPADVAESADGTKSHPKIPLQDTPCCVSCPICGEVTERPKVHDWKSCVPQGTGGSNPPLSASIKTTKSPLGIRSGASAAGGRKADRMSASASAGEPTQEQAGCLRRSGRIPPSPPVLKSLVAFWSLPTEVTAGSRATDGRKLRQARKGAAVVAFSVCRGGAWLSLVPAILFGVADGLNPFLCSEIFEAHVVSGTGPQVAPPVF